MAEQISLPVPIQIKGIVKKKVDEVLEKKRGKVLDWIGYPVIYRFFYIYLFKKYKHSCRLYSEDYLGIDLERRLDYNSMYTLQKQASQFKKCYDKGSDMIIIPLRYSTSPTSGHANFLLFKREPRIIERFEPYGQKVIKSSFVDESIEYFVNEINKLIDKPIRYSPVEESCHEIGVQYQEEHIEAQPKKKFEGSGYCVIWSMFFAELSLLNPELNFKQLTDIIYNIKPPGVYMRDIARGYVYFFYEKMAKYFGRYIAEITTFDNYIKKLSKSGFKSRDVIAVNEILDELFDIEIELYEKPDLTVEELYISNENIKKFFKLRKERERMLDKKRRIKEKIIKCELKENVLYKMRLNKEYLNAFTPVTINKPSEALVMNLSNAKISKVSTPLKVQSKPISSIKNKSLKVKPPCKPGKERNANGRCVKKQTEKKSKPISKEKTMKVKPPCKPGKERNANGRCVKKQTEKKSKPISNIKNKSLKVKPPCKPGKERNANGRCVKKENIK